MGINLPVIWAIIILFGLLMYVVMDGFDLGIGLLYPFFKSELDRDVMMNSVAPVWDGNETWLVLGGAGLLAAFPTAYAVILSALHLPLILMLIGLIFRGVAFEFRFKSRDHERHLWDKAFFLGSLIASFFQGVTLGAYISGIRVNNYAYAGGPLDWLTPFAIFTGIGVVIAYALLGSTWLIMKTEDSLQQRSYALARLIGLAFLVCCIAICLWTPKVVPTIADRWLEFPNLLLFALIPILGAGLTVMLRDSLSERRQRLPFLCVLCLVTLTYLGFAASIWPHIVPLSISITEAASPPQSQGFALVGALFILPIILGYTAWSYYVFRGKVKHGEGYH